MPASSTSLRSFFAEYDRESAINNIPALVTRFADVFLAAGPEGTKAVTQMDFALLLPKRKQFFDSVGCTSSALAAIHETPLDARFVLAQTTWKMIFTRHAGEAEDVLLDSTFIVDTGGPAPKIVFYLSHQDLLAILRDRGITTG